MAGDLPLGIRSVSEATWRLMLALPDTPRLGRSRDKDCGCEGDWLVFCLARRRLSTR
jgi:hypothetical protein